MILESRTVDAERFKRETGWEITEEGACKGETCIPLPEAVRTGMDAIALAEAMGLPVVEDQAQCPHLPHDDFTVPDNRLGLDAPDAQDSRFWQVDDRREGVYLVHAQIGDGERPAGQVVGQRFAHPRPFKDFIYSTGKS